MSDATGRLGVAAENLERLGRLDRRDRRHGGSQNPGRFAGRASPAGGGSGIRQRKQGVWPGRIVIVWPAAPTTPAKIQGIESRTAEIVDQDSGFEKLSVPSRIRSTPAANSAMLR